MPSIPLRSRMKSLSTVTVAFAGILLAACLAVVGLAGLALIRSRAQFQEQAETTARNLCVVLTDNLRTSYEKIDIALRVVEEDIEQRPSLGARDGHLDAFMERQRVKIPDLFALRSANAEGIIEHGNEVQPGSRISLADRDYFLALKAHPGAGLVFSKPLRSRVTGKWEIVLARRLDRPNGSFGGVVYGALDLEKMGARFAALSIGQEGSISLRDPELALIVREGNSQDATGQAGVSPEFRARLQAGQEHGTYTAVAPPDGVRRIYAFAHLRPYGQYLHVGLGEREVFESWRRERHQILGFAALCLLLLGVSTWGAHRAWNRQQRNEERLRIREALLAEANQRLLEANEQKNHFLGIVAHDLRNPLNGILLAAQLLEEEDDLERVGATARKIHGEGMEMSALIGRFLDIARIDSGEMRAEPEPCDLADLVRHIVGRHLGRSQQKGIAFAFRIPESGTGIHADPKFVKEVLDNLVSNALKFSPPGSTITLRLEAGPEEVVASVEDQGPGLTEEDKARLFGRFARLSAQPTGGEKSTGLGLSIAKHMIEATGGRIWVDSRPGEGASFRIALPKGLDPGMV